MAAVMKTAADFDEANYTTEQDLVNRLIAENKLIRDILELNQIRSTLAQKSVSKRTDEGVQTDL